MLDLLKALFGRSSQGLLGCPSHSRPIVSWQAVVLYRLLG